MYKNEVFDSLREKITYKEDDSFNFTTPEEVAEGIYFLTQNKSANGCILVLDRGQHLRRHIV
jgi:hypothetical protein